MNSENATPVAPVHAIVPRPWRDREQCTYVIECKEIACVKIGRAYDVDKRIATLQTGCPLDLEVYKTFNVDIEFELHAMFSDKRRRGEWFNAEALSVAIAAEYIVKYGIFPEHRSPNEWGICAADLLFGGPQLVTMGDAKHWIDDGREFAFKWVSLDEMLAINEKSEEERCQIAEKMLGY
jgi:hypothetical protein